MESIDIEEMDCDTCLKMQEILSYEIDDMEFFEFAIDNLIEISGYITQGNLNIRTHKDITVTPKNASGKPAPVPARKTMSGWRTAWPGGRRAVWRACPTISVADEM